MRPVAAATKANFAIESASTDAESDAIPDPESVGPGPGSITLGLSTSGKVEGTAPNCTNQP